MLQHPLEIHNLNPTTLGPPSPASLLPPSQTIEISIDNLRVLDINFPTRNTIDVLLHDAYLPEFRSKLLKIDSHLIQDFSPLDHHHIADPKYQDLSEERRTQLAKALHQDRCLRAIYFIRPNVLPGVARFFVRQGWVSPHAAQDIIHQRLPRPNKRRPEPCSFVNPSLTSTQPTGTPVAPQGSASQVLSGSPLQDWSGNLVTTQDMDTTPDFASSASGSESSCPGSPIADAVGLSQ